MIHLILGIFWILMAVPTFLFWKDSILLVLLMSLYANAEASFAAWEARRKPKAKTTRAKWRYATERYSFGRSVRRQPAKLYRPVRLR